MSYKLNSIPLANYGITPARGPLSNIALEGMLDMPNRLGKTFHDWLDEEGIEPYVEPDEIFFNGRKITFYGYITATSQQEAVLKLRDLYDDFGRVTDLIDLETPWGVFQVYLKEKINVEYLGNGSATLQLVFEEVSVPFPNLVLPEERTVRQYHVDFIPFSAFGAFITETDGQYDRPELKEAVFTSYNQAGYQLTKIGQSKIDLSLVFHAPDWATLKSNVQRFHQVLGASGTRIVNVDDTEREGFAVGGFKANQIKVMDGLAVCRVAVSLLLAFDGEPVINEYLVDEQIDGIMDDQGNFLSISRAETFELIDDQGRGIGTETLTPITL
jgi:hypothetical protein